MNNLIDYYLELELRRRQVARAETWVDYTPSAMVISLTMWMWMIGLLS